MRKFVLDTCILLHYIRQNDTARRVEAQLNLLATDAVLFISSATVGEIEGFLQRQKWGQPKVKQMKKLLKNMVAIDIDATDYQLMQSYATLWNYSKNALAGNKLGRSIGIGQNDVWIAALAKTAKAELVTTDSDFDHLNGQWITVHKF